MIYKNYVNINEFGEFYFPSNLSIWDNYAYNQIERIISSNSMEVHSNSHHKPYIQKLNTIIKNYTDLFSKNFKDIFDIIEICDEIISDLTKGIDDHDNNKLYKLLIKVKFLAGGHLNHTFFWSLLTTITNQPSNQFLNIIEENFTNFDSFIDQAIEVGVNHMGSGWLWLIAKYNKQSQVDLEWITTDNHNFPFNDKPILVVDLWEHAHYLDYTNHKEEYLRGIFSIIDWNTVEENLSNE